MDDITSIIATLKDTRKSLSKLYALRPLLWELRAALYKSIAYDDSLHPRDPVTKRFINKYDVDTLLSLATSSKEQGIIQAHYNKGYAFGIEAASYPRAIRLLQEANDALVPFYDGIFLSKNRIKGALTRIQVAENIGLKVGAKIALINALKDIPVAGANRGRAMTHIEANECRPNPHCKDVDAKERGYTRNCQSCVVAYELRRRGYNVEALAYINYGVVMDLSYDTTITWIDADTGRPPIPYIHDNAKDRTSLVEWLKAHMIQGCRYHMSYHTIYSAHIVTVTLGEDGTPIIYDPQDGAIDTVEQYEFKYIYGRCYTQLYQVDALQINPDIVDYVVKEADSDTGSNK